MLLFHHMLQRLFVYICLVNIYEIRNFHTFQLFLVHNTSLNLPIKHLDQLSKESFQQHCTFQESWYLGKLHHSLLSVLKYSFREILNLQVPIFLLLVQVVLGILKNFNRLNQKHRLYQSKATEFNIWLSKQLQLCQSMHITLQLDHYKHLRFLERQKQLLIDFKLGKLIWIVKRSKKVSPLFFKALIGSTNP